MQLKTILYVSESTETHAGRSVPAGLWEILRTARTHNARFNIAGILAYSRGKYLQVLEGPPLQVDSLMVKIGQDSRHTNVTTIVDSLSAQRYFPSWPMRFMGSLVKDERFSSCIDQFAEQGIDASKRLLLGHFLPDFREHSARGYEGQELFLSAWPSFTSVEQSPASVSLCARLVAAPCLYQELIDGIEYGGADQVNRVLDQLDRLNLLMLMEDEPQLALYAPQPANDGFYHKVKMFLGLGG